MAKKRLDRLSRTPALLGAFHPANRAFPPSSNGGATKEPVRSGPALRRLVSQSPEDPGRPASEIINQIGLTRKIGKNWVGHIHWSAKGLMKNQGGISTALAKSYTQPVAVPPMPWISKAIPDQAQVGATTSGSDTRIRWTVPPSASKVAVQARYGKTWRTVAIVPAGAGSISIPKGRCHRSLHIEPLWQFIGSTSPRPQVIRHRYARTP